MQTLIGNRILDALPSAESAPLRAALEPVALAAYDVVYVAGAPIAAIYFPVTAVLSVLTVMRDGAAVEIGTFGCEGISGAQIVLGSDRSPSQMICQVPGDAYRLPVAAFDAQLASSPNLRRLVRRYAQALFNFMGQSIACNRLHAVNERCARWLLLTHDRVSGDAFSLTQEFLAIMLGVHRPVVSLAAAALQVAGYIRYRRGQVEVRDRAGLESAACECYRINADEFARVV
ncbi:MAG TPA: Crp/Fnr family transcriptional regulator [Candidatus Baltobacteraceae bacterium]